MRAVMLVVLLLARLSFADDAPLKCFTPGEIENIANVKAADEKRKAHDAAVIKSLEADAGKVPVVPLVVTAALAIGAGFAIGFGVKAATQPRP